MVNILDLIKKIKKSILHMFCHSSESLINFFLRTSHMRSCELRDTEYTKSAYN